MSKTARGCGWRAPKQHPAILPWPSSLLVPELILESGMCRQHIAAGASSAEATKRHPPNMRGNSIPRRLTSAANAELLDQALVAAFVGALEIVEKLATLRHHLQQASPRMIVLHVSLEMLGEIIDPFGQDRDLHLRRPGVAGLLRVSLDDFRLTLRRNRHRQIPSWRPALPCSPARLKTRLGTISPPSTSARAISWPDAVTYSVPLKTGASRPRNRTAWPRWSLAASALLTASAGMSSSAVSTGSSASARLPSPAAAFWHKDSSSASEIMSLSLNGPTWVRRSAITCPRQPRT